MAEHPRHDPRDRKLRFTCTLTQKECAAFRWWHGPMCGADDIVDGFQCKRYRAPFIDQTKSKSPYQTLL